MTEYTSAATTTTNQAAGPEGDAAPVPTQHHPEFRSRADPGRPDLTEFPEPYAEGNRVRVKGGRGFSKVYTIAEVLGNGYYRLQDGIQVLPKTYSERDLRRERQ